MSLTTLGEVLLNPVELSLDADLFLPYGEAWNSTTRCAVIPVDRYAVEDEVPNLAVQNSLERALQIAQVQDVVVNARQQCNQITVENLVTAFLFYYDRDAFINFDTIDELKNPPELPLGRFLKSKSLGGNEFISAMRVIKDAQSK